MKFSKGDQVEVASNEDGFRGAWFRAEVLKKQGNGYLVEYKELLDDNGTQPLREKVDAVLLRPVPPESKRVSFEPCEEVDAYDNDGWWVGIVTKIVKMPPNAVYSVYFMQTKEHISFPHSKLRPHFEFINEKWVNASKGLVGIPSDDFKELTKKTGNNIPFVFAKSGEAEEVPHLVSSPRTEAVDKKRETKTPKTARNSSRHSGKMTDNILKESDTGNSDGHVESLSGGRRLSSRMTRGKQRSRLDNLTSGVTDRHITENVTDAVDIVVEKVTDSANVTASGNDPKSGKNTAQASPLRKCPPRKEKGLREVSTNGDSEKVSLGVNSDANKCANQVVIAMGAVTGKQKTPKKRGNGEENVSTKKKKIQSNAVPVVSPEGNVASRDQNCASNPVPASVNANPDNVVHCEVSPKSLNVKNQSMRIFHETGLVKNQSVVPPVSPEISETQYTFTIPHVSCVEGTDGVLQGKASLRNLRLATYHSVLQVLYFQGSHNWKYEILLTNLREALNISNEEHAAELKRVTNGRYD